MFKKKIALLGLMTLAFAALTQSALAHVALQDSNPKDGTAITEFPADIWGQFGVLSATICRSAN